MASMCSGALAALQAVLDVVEYSGQVCHGVDHIVRARCAQLLAHTLANVFQLFRAGGLVLGERHASGTA